jgi:RHS repeat-associated protein
VTDSLGNVVSSVELDPWGGDTNRSSNAAFQPKKFTSYHRDANGSDEAMFRRYNRWHSRFDQPDPYEGSYDLTDPQSFNRYAYVQNDPVNFIDPNGLFGAGDHDNTVLRPCVLIDGVDTCQGMHISPNAFLVTQYFHTGGGYLERGIYSGSLTPLLPQNPYDVRHIIRDARRKLEADRRNRQAWFEYTNCVKNNPATVAAINEFEKAWNKAMFESLDDPIPWVILGAKVGRHSMNGVRLLSRANVFSLALTGIEVALLSGVPPSVSDRLWKAREEKLKPIQDQCMKEIQQKYWFTPTRL